MGLEGFGSGVSGQSRAQPRHPGLSGKFRGGKVFGSWCLAGASVLLVIWRGLSWDRGANDCIALLFMWEPVISMCCLNTGKSGLNLLSHVTGRKAKKKTQNTESSGHLEYASDRVLLV